MGLASLAPSSALQTALALSDVAFAHPEALWGGLAIALPVLAAHLYRRRRRRMAVAFSPLIREAVGPVHARGAWKRVREAIRLLCRVAAVAALALALAGPRPAHAATPIEDLVIVLDADETTTCLEPEGGPLEGKTRFDRQVALARAHVLARSAGRVGVVLAGRTPRTLVAPTELRSEIAPTLTTPAVAPDGGHGDLAAAVAVAREAKAVDRALAILVISSREVPTATTGPDVRIEGAGTVDDDQGFVDASVTPDAEGSGFDIRATVRNFSSIASKRTLVAELTDGVGRSSASSQTIEVEAGSETSVSTHVDAVPEMPFLLWTIGTRDPSGNPIERDAWRHDDRFVAALVPRARPSVLVVHGGTPRPFVRALLDAMGDSIDRAASGFVPVSGLADAKPRDVTIVDGVALPASALRKGAWIFVAPLPSAAATTLPFRVGREIHEPLVWRADTSDPLLRGVDLTTAYVARGTTIVGDSVRALASVEGEAVVADGAAGDVRWLAFGLDPEGSDLPVRAALPLLLANSIRRMGELPKAPLKPFYKDDEPIAPRVELGATTITDLRPGILRRVPAPDGLPKSVVSWGPASPLPFPLSPGVLYASTAGGGPQRVVVNRLDRSFDIRPVRPASPPPPRAPSPPEDEAAAWLRWLLFAAAGLLGIDLLLGAMGRQRLVAVPARSA